ncbi:uncharacterized protein LOC129947470 isoform X2 [Eupeodes corollae]|uniref:uncharacterized protein LOC129947470 isoform X2 n=1 Tax=Eupeodes corollae TaxID=290404 RepID=UPI00248FAEFB|nr:uncharacterized protein LOC129947470 isoform X2 [Eupeodes corollae]
MSSYRSYVPWKSNLQTSYKSGSSSAYSSRDDINGTRFGSSLSTPTSYRPSFSGGTYRVKRDTTPVTSPYVSRYSSTPTTATTSSKDEKDKSTTESLTRPIKDTTSNNVQQQKYLSGSLSKDSSSSLKTSPSSGRYSTSTSNLSKYGRRSRDPSPGQESLRSTSSLAATRIKSREPSPAARTLRGKSRDPSPAIESKSKLGTSYGSSSYRLTPSRNPSTSPGYTPRYGNSSSISYLSASDFRARSVSRAREIAERKSHDRESEKEAPIKVQKVLEASESKETTPEDEGEEEEENENDDEEEEEESESSSEEIFVPVSVCTRGTSPTPPSSSTVVRMRRNELAKTIEKTIKRSSKRPKTLEKGIQSDRMDDSTRYSRFGLSSRMSSYSPHESRYTPSLRYSSSVSPLVKSSRSRSRSDISDRKDDSKSQSPDTKACVSPKSKLSPPKNIRTSSRQASVENLSLGSKGSPELEGVVKTSITVAKLPNKDFRKSALNVGPTDRPRKSRTPSTSTDSDDKLESKKVQPPNGTTQFILRQEKSSSSSGSETSSASTKTSLKKKLLNGGESKIRQRCHPAKSSTSSTSPMSSSPSPSGHQNTTAKINVNMATEVNSESSSDNNRKLINKMSELTTTTPPPTIQQRETGALDASPKKSSKNKLKQPPPPVSETETEAAVDNDAVFDVVVVNKGNQIGTPDSFNSTQAIKAPLSSKEKHDDDDTSGKCNLLEKLGSISNFFAARQHDANSEPLYVDRRSSESASGDSISSDLKQKVSLTTTTTVPLKNRENSIDLNTTSTTTTTSPSTASITAPPSTEPVNTPEDGCEDTSIDWWQDNTSEQISTASALDIKDDMRYRLRHIDSGEVGWWLKNEDDDTLADDLKTLNQEDEEAPSEMTDPPVSNQMEETWWNQQNEGIYQDSKLENKEFDWPANENEAPVASIYPGPPKHVSPEAYESDETHKKSPESLQNGFIKLNICRVESGERPWWLDEDKSSASPKEVSPPKRYPSSNNLPLNKSSSNQNTDKLWWMQGPTKKIFNVRHVESGERPTWLTQNNDDEKPPRIQHNLKESEGESDEEEEEAEESENDEEVCNVTNDNDNNTLMERLPPLGDRASPDGLEDPTKHRKSPYESSIPMMKQTQIDCNGTANGFNAQKLFISRHTNIDELLGGSCRPMSPLIDRYGAAKNTFLEEITPDQVRIHDSTAQMPVIQRMERDEWDYGGPKVQPSWLDDAALQVYKDGDYGAYLDLESSLAEQTEEIEGLNTSRKNSLVVRTQLSVRVHAIIEKLLSSEGSELRRALFSLKQVFQEDKDLVHAFVALGGLNCLVRVGNGADQNYQNYILRALGQVMLYVDGMNGVMKHEPTMKWLYSLIASKYRLVVKTALKLLLVFVEYVETNCYLLVNAIHAVDSAQGTLPWSNIMKLLKDYDNADTELLIYATSLINKTLAGLNDQDSFYDESDLLEQQGMEGVIQRYMSRPGTDLDLLDQLQLYEAVLKFEDGEADGIRLPDNSLRKTMRYRPSTDTAERRKSRRHSTGTSPSVNKVIQSLKRFTTTTHGILDEDSSSSNNSNEYANNGYLKDTRLEPSITPGFRRRRERVERQKSFLREQQEAAANGIMSVFEKPTAFGQIVTAMPVHLKQNSDSPPDSLVLTNNNNDANNCSNNNATNNSLNANNITNFNNNNNTYNTINNNNGLEYCSPSKIMSPTNNGFDRNRQQQQQQLQPPVNLSNNGKQNGSPEFLSKKNLLMKSNATVINGIMKNINRNESENREAISYSSHKKFESDANRLNNFYSQMSTPKSQAAVLCQKNNNNNATIEKPARNNVITAGSDSPYHRLREMHSPSPVMMDMGLPVVPETEVVTPKEPVFIPPPPPPPPPPSFWYAPLSVQHPPPPSVNGGSSLTEMIAGKVTPTTATTTGVDEDEEVAGEDSDNENERPLLLLKRDHTVKDLTTKLSNLPMSPTQEDKLQNRIVGDMTGLISKAKEGLAKSKSKGDISRSSSVDQEIKKADPKKSENELHWEELVKSMSRPLNLCDMDFTDLNSEDEKDVLAPRGLGGGIPPPPPPQGGMVIPPPMMIGQIVCPPPMNMPPPLTNLVPPMFNYNNHQGNYSNNSSLNNSINGDVSGSSTVKKNKKTVKLFWKEVREDMIPVAIGKTIWDELPKSNVDTQKLEHLFESRAKDLMTKKQQEMNKNKEIIVLDHKRSNAINIAMTKLPPPRAIKAAILKMDATVVTREGIDKLLNMLPTDEERGKIQEAQMANPELPLGSAEQFLLTLASISELAARLKLWAFRLDFENSEKEIAEPLMDLKQGIELLRQNRTFKCILSTLLSVGIFLNGAPVKGFQIEYLAKVPEVKDTVHKHSLLHHLCHMVMETCTDTTDLYSEIGPITRASKADFADLAHNLIQLEIECKLSWDRLKLIAKHDCPPQLKQKLVDFLADCAERIIILQIVHRRIINRYRKFLLWLGVPQHSVAESKPNEFCRIVSEFALEYRTTRERVQQQIEKKANHRERNKTRGKMIIDVAKFRTKEDRADAELKELLGSPSPGNASLDGTLTWRRRRAENLRSPIIKQNDDNFTDGDDEILESLVKTATKTSGPRPTPRERKRTRHADRKSLKRSRTREGFTIEKAPSP